VAERGVGGDANLAGGAERGIAGKGNHVGRARVAEEIGVKFRERGVGEEHQRKFSGRRAAAKFSGVRIEGGDDVSNGAAVEPQARVAVRDGDGTGIHRREHTLADRGGQGEMRCLGDMSETAAAVSAAE
jgi:hypothetical protein